MIIYMIYGLYGRPAPFFHRPIPWPHIGRSHGSNMRIIRCIEVQPDLITYSTLLKGYCQVGDLDKALHVAATIKAGNSKQNHSWVMMRKAITEYTLWLCQNSY